MCGFEFIASEPGPGLWPLFRMARLTSGVSAVLHWNEKEMDAAFLLTIGSFLLTVELFYLQLTILAFLLTIGAFLLTALASLLTVGACLLTVGKCV